MVAAYDAVISRRARIALLSAAAIVGWPLQSAWAQTAAGAQPAPADATTPGTIGEVVVTAQRRSEKLQDVPIAITALAAEELHPGAVSNTADLTKVIPNLNFNEGTGAYALPVLRGVGTNSQGPGIENPVATYIDGVYIASPASQLFELSDVAQVAVLKGPQGTLFGRNATGGVIQVTTKAPSHDFQANGDVTVGNLQTFGQNFYVSGGLSNRLSAGLAVTHDDQQKGFGHNLFTGHDVKTHEVTALRGKLRWEPSEHTAITLSGDYIDRTAAETTNRPLLRVSDGTYPVGGPFDVNVNFDPRIRVKGGGVSLTITHDFDAVQLVSITASRQDRVNILFDADLTVQAGPNALTINQLQRNKQFSQELQLISNTSGPLSYTAGLYYMSADSKYAPANTLPFGTTISLYSDEPLKSYAGFAQLTYRIGESTNLTGGLRYTTDERGLISDQFRIANGVSTKIVTPINTSKTFDKVTWRLSVDHRFSPEFLTYASYNRGFISGTFAPQNFPATVLSPEQLDAFEVGFKSDLLDRRIRFNPSIFYYDYRNRHVLTIINGFQTAFVADKATMYGLDADLTFLPTDQLSLTAGLGLLHTHYDDFHRGFVTTPLAAGGNAVAFADDSGKQLEGASPLTLTLKSSYRLPTTVGDFQGTASFYHNGGWFAGPDNRGKQPAYNTVDADVLWTPSFNQNISVRLWGKNLTDAVYALQFSQTTFADNSLRAAGRTYGGTLGFRF